jgi:hypothetical protein
MPLSLDGTTGISASGNITGGNVIASGALIVGSFAPASVSTAGNVTGGNLVTAGLVTSTGNVTGGNLLTAGLISATSSITSAANVVGGNISTAGLITATGNVTGGNILTAGIMSSTGNGIHGNILTAGLISATSNMLTAGYITATGNVLGNIFTVNLGNTTGAAIVNGGGNGVGNIGSATGYFNTIHAKATSAQYADLAEMYLADVTLHAGTVVEFGGNQEITISCTNHSPRVAGIISTRPSHLMNATLSGEHAYPVALTGRVPCTVIGLITKGDCLVSSDHPGAARRLDPEKFVPGCIIGKALQDHHSESIGTIEVAVGRF